METDEYFKFTSTHQKGAKTETHKLQLQICAGHDGGRKEVRVEKSLDILHQDGWTDTHLTTPHSQNTSRFQVTDAHTQNTSKFAL